MEDQTKQVKPDWEKLEGQEREEALSGRSAKDGLEIMESLGFKNTPLGTATDMTPIEDWKKRGLACQFEHTIANMPQMPFVGFGQTVVPMDKLQQNMNLFVCRRFNRMCPAGVLQVLKCFGKPQEPVEVPETAKAEAKKGSK